MSEYAWVLPLIPIAGTALILIGLRLLPAASADRRQMEFDFPQSKRQAIAKSNRGDVISEKVSQRLQG